MKNKSFEKFNKFIEKNISQERINNIDKKARREIINYKLAEIRKKYNITQTDFPSFKQSSISRLEAQTDIKLSTLIDYFHDMNMELEIKVKPLNSKKSEVIYKG